MENKTLTAGLLQMDIFWMQPDRNLELIEKELSQSNIRPDLLILPEMFTTAYILQPVNQKDTIIQLEKSMDKLKEISKTYKVAITGSTPWYTAGKFYNRCILIDSDTISYYDKIHLYTPVNEHLEYTPGDNIVDFLVKGVRIRPLICYDLRFPYLAMMGSPYDLLIYVANWPVPRINHWNALLRARAIENQVYTIGVNRTGGDENKINYCGSSAFYQFDGEEILNLNDRQNLHTVQLSFDQQSEYRKKLPFSRDRKEILMH
jgi:omega-amidase